MLPAAEVVLYEGAAKMCNELWDDLVAHLSNTPRRGANPVLSVVECC